MENSPSRIFSSRIGLACGLATLGITLSITFSSCIFIGNRANETSTRGVGAELLELNKAKEMGLLSQEEFVKQRALILADPSTKKK